MCIHLDRARALVAEAEQSGEPPRLPPISPRAAELLIKRLRRIRPEHTKASPDTQAA